MPEVTNELIYEVLKQVQTRLANIEDGQRGMRDELSAIRTHMTAMQQDVNNLYSLTAQSVKRLERIERRLELTAAE